MILFTAHRAAIALCLWLALGLAPAAAHDFWIEPSAFRPAAGAPVTATLRVGEDFSGESQPLVPDWFRDFALYAGDQRQPVRGLVGDDPAGRFTVASGGTQVIGYHSTPSFVAIDPETFDEYLDAEGLEWVRAQRRARGSSEQPARELFSRCAKALLLPAGQRPGNGHDRQLGYTLELIPRIDPYSLGSGAELPLELRYRGAPIADILVIAFTAEHPEDQQRLRTDSAGEVRIRLSRPGRWLVKAVHIIELPDAVEVADWESFWASLTFSVLL